MRFPALGISPTARPRAPSGAAREHSPLQRRPANQKCEALRAHPSSPSFPRTAGILVGPGAESCGPAGTECTRVKTAGHGAAGVRARDAPQGGKARAAAVGAWRGARPGPAEPRAGRGASGRAARARDEDSELPAKGKRAPTGRLLWDGRAPRGAPRCSLPASCCTAA